MSGPPGGGPVLEGPARARVVPSSYLYCHDPPAAALMSAAGPPLRSPAFLLRANPALPHYAALSRTLPLSSTRCRYLHPPILPSLAGFKH